MKSIEEVGLFEVLVVETERLRHTDSNLLIPSPITRIDLKYT